MSFLKNLTIRAFVASGILFLLCVLAAAVAYGLIRANVPQEPSREEFLKSTFDSISHYPDSHVIAKGIHSDPIPTTSYISCGTIEYYALMGTQGAYADVRSYYENQFVKSNWKIDNGVLSLMGGINHDTTIYVYKVGTEDFLPLRFQEIGGEMIKQAQKQYATVFFIDISNKASDACN